MRRFIQVAHIRAGLVQIALVDGGADIEIFRVVGHIEPDVLLGVHGGGVKLPEVAPGGLAMAGRGGHDGAAAPFGVGDSAVDRDCLGDGRRGVLHEHVYVLPGVVERDPEALPSLCAMLPGPPQKA